MIICISFLAIQILQVYPQCCPDVEVSIPKPLSLYKKANISGSSWIIFCFLCTTSEY